MPVFFLKLAPIAISVAQGVRLVEVVTVMVGGT